jgi:serine O-acetyltransferase
MNESLNPQEPVARLLSRRCLGRGAVVMLKLLGVELPRSVRTGRGLRLPHGAVGLVVHPSTVIEDNVTLYRGVTVGRADVHRRPPEGIQRGCVIIEEGALVGAGAAILFRTGTELRLGRGCVIGANAVVTQSVPPFEVWSGIPARRMAASQHRETTAWRGELA